MTKHYMSQETTDSRPDRKRLAELKERHKKLSAERAKLWEEIDRIRAKREKIMLEAAKALGLR